MAHVVAVFDPPLQLSNGRIYTAQACGRQREDGRWEGWLEFVPDDTSVVLRTERETTQRNLAELEHWASTLTPVYLQGALDRTLTPPPPVVADEPVVPSVYAQPAPSRADVIPINVADTARGQLLDPFVEIARGEEECARLGKTYSRRTVRDHCGKQSRGRLCRSRSNDHPRASRMDRWRCPLAPRVLTIGVFHKIMESRLRDPVYRGLAS